MAQHRVAPDPVAPDRLRDALEEGAAFAHEDAMCVLLINATIDGLVQTAPHLNGRRSQQSRIGEQVKAEQLLAQLGEEAKAAQLLGKGDARKVPAQQLS